jgi:hypothetical protein
MCTRLDGADPTAPLGAHQQRSKDMTILTIKLSTAQRDAVVAELRLSLARGGKDPLLAEALAELTERARDYVLYAQEREGWIKDASATA